MNISRILVLLVIAVIMGLGTSANAADKKEFNTAPVTNNGVRWRIGYYEGLKQLS